MVRKQFYHLICFSLWTDGNRAQLMFPLKSIYRCGLKRFDIIFEIRIVYVFCLSDNGFKFDDKILSYTSGYQITEPTYSKCSLTLIFSN